jgi:DNA-binding MarR family transcriptional regulator
MAAKSFEEAQHANVGRMHDAWVLFYRSSHLISRGREHSFAEVGLTQQHYNVLSTLDRLGGQSSVSELSRRLFRNANSVSTLVERMEKGGLVKKVVDAEDRRAVVVTMTDNGREMLIKGAVPGWEVVERIFSCLDHAETNTMVALLEKIYQKSLEVESDCLKRAGDWKTLETDVTSF